MKKTDPSQGPIHKSVARDEARQVFRQFAWNLAGTLAQPAKPTVRRAAARAKTPARRAGAGRSK